MENDEKVVKRGRFLHDGLVFGDVEIVQTAGGASSDDNCGAEHPGNGNDETSFAIRCTLSTAATDPLWENGACKSLNEAIERVEACCPELTWVN